MPPLPPRVEKLLSEFPAEELTKLAATRRDFHAHPELAYAERRTAGVIADRLAGLGLAPRTGIGKTGVLADTGTDRGHGERLLLRADMDALPLEEATGLPFTSSSPGRMHACGHDGHMAIGLAVAERLVRSIPERGLRFLFQPAEEGHRGADACVEDGALDGVGAALGLHLWNGIGLGRIGVNHGALMAAVDEFTIEIESPGGHGAMPHETVDPILAAARVIESLQSVVSREISPLDSAVVTIGRIQGGTTFNIIPRSVTLQGTARSFTPETGKALPEKIARIVHGTAAACGVAARIRYERLNGATVNDPRIADIVIAAAARIVGQENVDTDARTLAGEDMCVYLDRVPGCFFFVGCAPEADRAAGPHHSPRFDFDERALAIGVAVLEAAARDVAARI